MIRSTWRDATRKRLLQRAGEPDGIAAVAVVPATSGCRFRQRQNVIVDGGATISDFSKSWPSSEAVSRQGDSKGVGNELYDPSPKLGSDVAVGA